MMTFIYIYLAVWWFTNFEPIQRGLEWLMLKFKPNMLTEAIWTILGCQYCSTLWITLILTGSIVGALFCSMIAQIHKKMIE